MFYRSCSLDDDLSQQGVFLRRYEYLMWEEATPTVAGSNWELDAIEVGASLGMSTSAVLNRFSAVYTMWNLPATYKVFRQHWHLDMPRLLAISSALSQTDNYPQYDEAIAEFLSPSVEDEAVPSARQIRNFIRSLQEPYDQSQDEEEDQLWFVPATNGRTAVGVVTSDATASLIRERLRAEAAQTEQPMGEVLLKLVQGDAKVVLNVYEDTSGKIRTAGGAQFSEIEATWLRERAARRVLSRDQSTEAYRFTERMRAFIAGRDGHCRYPGCTVPDYACDIDHVVEFDRGGKTTPANAQLLCRHHHNLKTYKHLTCSIDDQAVVTWNIGDKEIRTTPGGALTNPP